MAITGIGNNHNVYESAYASQKNEAAKETETKKAETKETAATQAENTKSSANNKVADYYSYLSKNYDCVKNGNVAISGSFLRQCANDPEKAKYLEENLSLYNELRDQGYESAKQNAQRLGARLVSYSESWSIDSTGNIAMMTSTTVTTDNGTKSREELNEEREERLKEKKEEAKKAEKAKAEKEEEQEQLEKLRESAGAKEQIYIKENEAGNDIENYAAVRRNKPEDAYYPKFDMGI